MKKSLWVSVVLSLWLLMSYSYCFASASPHIRVGLMVDQPSVIVGMDLNYQIVDADSGLVLLQQSAHQKAVISRSNGQWDLNGKKVRARVIRVVAKRDDSKNFIEVNRRLYRGDISMHQTRDKMGITVVNSLSIEEYLYGVVPREISPSWPMEALKAQAVAARSYAWTNMGRYANDGFDVSSGTDSQAYGGASVEHARTTAAVKQTRGIIITYKGKPVPAYFHGSAGGFTENSENVWGSYQPYLRGVKDFDQKSPHYAWEKSFTAAEIEYLLARNGYDIGKVQAIILSKLTSQPVEANGRGISGRVKEIRIIGSNGPVLLTGNKLRSILLLPSTLFDIQVVLKNPKEVKVPITDSYGDHETKKIPINMKPFPVHAAKESLHRVSGRSNETIIIAGFGWGHGLGMSQWGAKAMAEKRPVDDVEYYKAILKHYYQGIELDRLY